MFNLSEYLRDDKDYEYFGYILARDCHERSKDETLLSGSSPVTSINVRTYFDANFLQSFLIALDDQKKYNPTHFNRCQVYLGVFAMKHGVWIWKKDSELMQYALINAYFKGEKGDIIAEAYRNYERIMEDDTDDGEGHVDD